MGVSGWRPISKPVSRLIALGSHHRSHRRLLTAESPARPRTGRVDALIVPASRPVSWLRTAMELASSLECVLVALCSRQVNAHEVIVLGEQLGVTTVAVEMNAGIGLTPSLGTRAVLEGSPFERVSDLSDKRNLGLLLAWVAGWDCVLFLDDDINNVDPSDVEAAASLLDHYRAVGLDNVGFPDNSVVCHAHRAVGGAQEQFVGGGALAVSPLGARSFFPRVYNDDWFFVIGLAAPPRLAVTGSVKQVAFDPFADPKRARREEFGDCLAEGLYWLLDGNRSLELADRAHWRDFLARRRRFIGRLLRLADLAQPSMRERICASLEVALDVNKVITPEICAEYVALWRSDLVTWRRHLDGLPTGVGVERAIAELGLGS